MKIKAVKQKLAAINRQGQCKRTEARRLPTYLPMPQVLMQVYTPYLMQLSAVVGSALHALTRKPRDSLLGP